ncbi:MAG: response regulator [Desulfobacterales bacterium]|nr:response regulator [Desulfobacterales bacterium]
MSYLENSSKEKLLLDINDLQKENAALKQEVKDLKMIIETTSAHSDDMAEDLLNQVESTLRESEKRFRLITETIPVPITVARACDNIIIYANAYTGALLDVPANSIIGHNALSIFNSDDRKALIDILNVQGYVNNYELQGKRFNGTPFWVALFVQSIPFNDEPCFLSALYNISERKRFENALKTAYSELEKRVIERTAELRLTNEELKKAKEVADIATKAKSEFLANMSHEIRTPLSGVITASELALSTELAPKAEQYLKIIHSSGNALLGVINDILDFSKIEAGKLTFEKISFRLDKLLNELVDIFISKTSEKGIEFLLDMQPDIPLTFIGDPFRLKQVITNFIGNAIKFTENGGSITLGVNCLNISEKNAHLLFFVKDSGVGMKPDQTKNLFQPFTQADASITRKYGGTGLGLTISKQIVALMGGKISVESEYMKGTIFYINLLLDRESDAHDIKFVVSDDVKKLRILIIDNCVDRQLIISKLLNFYGCHVESWSSGIEAIDLLRHYKKQSFDLIIIDWKISDINIIEFATIVRKELNLNLPIIFLTEFGKEFSNLEFQKMNINVFLTKPVNVFTLFNAITEAIGKKKIITSKKDKLIDKIQLKNKLKNSRILLAEDNLTNQEILVAVLKQVGIIVEIANNGLEAVEMVKKNFFDAVLMDIQMPEMDGYDATEMIREWESNSNNSFKKRLPIIAMTANVLKGADEKCLDAGMDGYLSKPINQAQLFSTLSKFIKDKGMSSSIDEAKEINKESYPVKPAIDTHDNESILPIELQGIDIHEALKALSLDETTFKNILIGFLRTNQNTSYKVRDAFIKKDWELLCNILHSIKGSSSNICAFSLQKEALELEQAFKKGKVKDSTDVRLLNNFEIALKEVLDSITAISKKAVKNKPIIQQDNENISVNIEQLTFVMNNLLNAIKRADPNGVRTWIETLKIELSDSFLKELCDFLSNYDYADAEKELTKIAEKFAVKLR